MRNQNSNHVGAFTHVANSARNLFFRRSNPVTKSLRQKPAASACVTAPWQWRAAASHRPKPSRRLRQSAYRALCLPALATNPPPLCAAHQDILRPSHSAAQTAGSRESSRKTAVYLASRNQFAPAIHPGQCQPHVMPVVPDRPFLRRYKAQPTISLALSSRPRRSHKSNRVAALQMKIHAAYRRPVRRIVLEASLG